MSLPILLIAVVIGISIIVAAIHFSGGSKAVTIASTEQAVARFQDDYPEQPIGAVWLTVAADAAFLELSNGGTGVVQAFGDRFVTRSLAPRDIAACSRVAATGVSLRITDFTFPGGEFVFSDAATADAIVAQLTASEKYAVEAAR